MLCVSTQFLPTSLRDRYRSDPVEVARLVEGGANLWASNDFTLIGWGEAWNYGKSLRQNTPDFPPAALNVPLVGGSGSDNNSDFALSHADAAWTLVAARAHIEDAVGLAGSGLIAFASFGFTPRTPPILTVPRFLVGFGSEAAWVSVAYQAEKPNPNLAKALGEEVQRILNGSSPKRLPWGRAVAAESVEVGQQRHREIVAQVRQRLLRGEAEKVVLAREVVMQLDRGQPGEVAAALAQRLRRAYPECWTYSVGNLVGATPEMLVETSGGKAHCRVLAGTFPAGENQRLRESEKDCHEHEIAVETVQTALESCAQEVRREKGPYLLELPNVVCGD